MRRDQLSKKRCQINSSISTDKDFPLKSHKNNRLLNGQNSGRFGAIISIAIIAAATVAKAHFVRIFDIDAHRGERRLSALLSKVLATSAKTVRPQRTAGKSA